MNLKIKHIIQLIEPSWLSASIDFVILLVVTGTALAANLVHTNTTDKFVANYLLRAAGNSYSQLSFKLTNIRLLNDLPLILFWILVGIASWFLVSNLYKSFFGAVEIAEEMNFVNVNRRALKREVVIKFVIRVVTIILWYLYIRILVFKFLPFYLYMFHKIVQDHSSSTIIQLVISILLFAVLLHINTIFLRVALLRRHVFGQLEED